MPVRLISPPPPPSPASLSWARVLLRHRRAATATTRGAHADRAECGRPADISPCAIPTRWTAHLDSPRTPVSAHAARSVRPAEWHGSTHTPSLLSPISRFGGSCTDVPARAVSVLSRPPRGRLRRLRRRGHGHCPGQHRLSAPRRRSATAPPVKATRSCFCDVNDGRSWNDSWRRAGRRREMAKIRRVVLHTFTPLRVAAGPASPRPAATPSCLCAQYRGQWAGDAAEGQGVCQFANGSVYLGTWVKGRPHDAHAYWVGDEGLSSPGDLLAGAHACTWAPNALRPHRPFSCLAASLPSRNLRGLLDQRGPLWTRHMHLSRRRSLPGLSRIRTPSVSLTSSLIPLHTRAHPTAPTHRASSLTTGHTAVVCS